MKWKGVVEQSWEPAENCAGCWAAIRAFRKAGAATLGTAAGQDQGGGDCDSMSSDDEAFSDGSAGSNGSDGSSSGGSGGSGSSSGSESSSPLTAKTLTAKPRAAAAAAASSVRVLGRRRGRSPGEPSLREGAAGR